MSKKPTPERLIQYFQNDAFARFAGCEIVEAGEGWAKVRMVIAPHHLNGVGLVHGGAVYMAADLAGAVAANSHGSVAVTLSATATYMKPRQGRQYSRHCAGGVAQPQDRRLHRGCGGRDDR